MNADRFTASFRIAGDELKPGEVSRRLGLTPSRSHAKGDANTGKSKGGKTIYYSPFSSGLWSLESALPRSSPLDDHLTWLLDRLEPKREVLETLRTEGLTMDFFCGLFAESVNFGESFSPELLSRLSRMNVPVGLDIYLGLGGKS